jgi:hypothetical protein
MSRIQTGYILDNMNNDLNSINYRQIVQISARTNLGSYPDDGSQQKAEILFSKTKVFLKKQELKKQELKNLIKNDCRHESTTPTSSKIKKPVFQKTDSIKFEKKVLYSKSNNLPIDLEVEDVASLGGSEDYYLLKKHSIHPNLIRKSTANGKPPLRCLLDSGDFLLANTTTPNRKFSAYVLSEGNHDRLVNFDKHKTQDFQFKKRELYNQFKSSIGNRYRRRTPLTSSNSTPNLFVNTKM